MKTTWYIFILTLLLLLLLSCSTTREVTEIKPKVIKPEIIRDTIKVKEKADTVIIGHEIIKNDTVRLVKYFPKKEKFFIKVKPDSIVLYDTIRTKQIIKEEIETPLLSKIGLVALGFFIMLMLIIIRGKI